MKIYAEKRSIG